MQPARVGAVVRLGAASALLGMLVFAPLSHAQTVLGTPQQANERIRALSTDARSAPHDYVIGRGDLVAVEVFDVPEMSRELRVSQTGTVGIPLVPVRLQLAGLTELQAEQKIEEVLEANGLVSHPQVSVVVKERRSNPITVVGAVTKPMVYEADRSVTLLEVLAEAGGITNDAGDTVIVTRPEIPASDTSAAEPPEIRPEDAVTPDSNSDTTGPGTKPESSASNAFPAPATPTSGIGPSSSSEPPPLTNTITVNLNDLIERGDTENNIVLHAGDVVTVPHSGIVYVMGAVARPGGFVVGNDRAQLTTLKVVALAGGLNRTAKRDQAVIVRRDSTGKQIEVPVDLAKVIKMQSEDVRMNPSDILYIPDNATKAALLKAGEIALGAGTAIAIFRLSYH